MIQKTITKLLERQHYWRTMSFDELSELYTSIFLRAIALNIIGIFVPIYLYKLGYGLPQIFLMYIVSFAIRPLVAYIVAKLIARYGPKHTMGHMVVCHIVYLGVLLTIGTMNWSLYILSVLGAFAIMGYTIAYEVDFSKVKHREHGGKELGYAHLFNKVGAIAGPLVGGLLASLTDPRYTIAVAMLTMLGSLIPIFMSAEPVRTRQHITLHGFPWRRHVHDFTSVPSLGIDATVSIVLWPLFLAVVIIPGSNVFAAIGALTAAGTVVALVTIKVIGRLIDEQQGGLLFRSGALLNSLVHVARAFVASPLQALPINLVNEPITSTFQMPYLKGLYDAADSVPGYRIVYIATIHATQSMGPLLLWTILLVFSIWLPADMVFRIGFILGAVLTLGMLSQRYPALVIKAYDKTSIIRHLAPR